MSRTATKRREQKKRAQNKVDKDLKRRVKNLAKLHTKHMPEVQKVKLSYISLGDLRQRFSTRHQPLPPSWPDEVHDFERYTSTDGGKPLLIYGSDNRLLALRIRSKQPESVKKLAEAIDALPTPKKWDAKGIQRGHYMSQHFGVWCPYMPQPRVTAEQRNAGAAADDFAELAQPLFREMTAVLGGVAPDVFQEFQRHALPPDAQRACGAWASCVVNNGGEDADQGNLHRDVRESPFGFSCAIACGDFEEGDLVLYELCLKIEMRSGDMVLFPDSLIHHTNEKVKGFRKSVVAFMQANMFDYWKRRDRTVKAPWERFEKSVTKSTEKGTVGSSRTRKP
jgi:hypothetical protein